MRYPSIAVHLAPYVMLSRRRTTINHAFAAAIAPNDHYEEVRVRQAILDLGQDPDQPLTCAYCGVPAETWDHVFATVKDSRFSGFGHRLGNLLPCCKPCNSRKGNKHWRAHLDNLGLGPQTSTERALVIESYLGKYAVLDDPSVESPDHQALRDIHRQILELLAEGDGIAARIRKTQAT